MDHVMLYQQKMIFLWVDTQERQTHQGQAGNIEGTTELLSLQTLGRCLPLLRCESLQINEAQIGFSQRMNTLHRSPCHKWECRPQNCMSGNQFGEAALQHLYMQLTLDMQNRWSGISNSFGGELLNHPDPFLSERERQVLRIRSRLNRKIPRRGSLGMILREQQSKLPDGRRREKTLQGQLSPEDRTHACHHTRDSQRMTTQGKEVSIDPHPLK